MIIKLLLILALAVAVIPTQEVIYPDPDPACATPWTLLWNIPESNRCGGGEYYLFFCQPHNIRKPLIYQAFCISSVYEYDLYQQYIPIVVR